MTKTASRVLKAGGLYFNGVNAYAVVGVQPDGSGKPFTVYGWSEITIAEWIYSHYPKSNTPVSFYSTIGDQWTDGIATYIMTSPQTDYAYIRAYFNTRKTDGTKMSRYTDFTACRGSWAFIVRRFTADREFSVWVNGVKLSSITIPNDEITILERNPNEAQYPTYYKRFVLGASTRLLDYMKVTYGEVRIYDRALSSYEIGEIYTKGAFIKDGLVLYLPFYEGEGDIAHDVSGYGNHGTIYGASWVVKKALRVLPKAG